MRARPRRGRPGSGWAASPLGCWACKAPLVAPGEGSISLRRWLTAYRVLRKAGALMRQSGSVRALPYGSACRVGRALAAAWPVAGRAPGAATIDSGYALWSARQLCPPPRRTPPRLPGGRWRGAGPGVPVRVPNQPGPVVGQPGGQRVPDQAVVVLPADPVRPPGQRPVGPGTDRARVRGLDGRPPLRPGRRRLRAGGAVRLRFRWPAGPAVSGYLSRPGVGGGDLRVATDHSARFFF